MAKIKIHPDRSVASVHRFGDAVAVYVGDGQTTYLSPTQARRLARALNRCAWSIANEKFVESSFGTVSIAKEEGQ